MVLVIWLNENVEYFVLPVVHGCGNVIECQNGAPGFYKVLKEIIVASGFFCYVGGMVRYDWERFARIPASNGSEPGKKEDSDSAGNPSVVRL